MPYSVFPNNAKKITKGKNTRWKKPGCKKVAISQYAPQSDAIAEKAVQRVKRKSSTVLPMTSMSSESCLTTEKGMNNIPGVFVQISRCDCLENTELRTSRYERVRRPNPGAETS